MGRELPANDKRHMGKLTVVMEVKHPRRQVPHPDTWDASPFFNILIQFFPRPYNFR